MQVVVLAAGMGKRLKDKTKDNTKCMVEIHGKPMIAHSFDILTRKQYGIKRIVMVVGYCGDKVKKYLGNEYNGVPIEYIDNPIYDKTNNIYSLALAKQQLTEDDTLLLESDLIYDAEIIDRLLASKYSNVAVVAKYLPWMDGTVLKLNGDDIVSLIPKQNFDYNEVDQYYKTVNIYKFSKNYMTESFLPFLEAYCKVLGQNQYYELVLRLLLTLERHDLKVLKLNQEQWYEIDDIPDYENAEMIFCKDLEKKYTLCSKRFGGYWRFNALKDYCYLVNPYFPTPRMMAEFKNSFEDLIANYPSGQNTQDTLASNLFETHNHEIVVGNGAAELINALMRTLPGKLGVFYPTFEEYPNRVPEDRLVKFFMKEPDFNYDTAFLESCLPQVDTLLLINPDNPSGNYLTKAQILQVIEKAAAMGKKIIVDESFADFADNYMEADSFLNSATLQAHPNLIVIKSISKSYGVPGLRLGILGTADRDLRNTVAKEASIWNINSFGEFFLQIAIKYKGAFRDACKKIAENRQIFFKELQKIPYLRPIPSQANYILCEVKAPYTSHELAIKLLAQNFFIKDCSTKAGFDGKNYIRLAVKSKEDNEALIKVLNTLGK